MRHLETLKAVCDLPTAPYAERAVVGFLRGWAKERGIAVREDGVGNVYMTYRRGRKNRRPLFIEAHMDHPGFLVTGRTKGGGVRAEFLGGVKPSYFVGERVRFFGEGGWTEAVRVMSVKAAKGKRGMTVELEGVKGKLAKGTLGMWDLADASVEGNLFSARVCDDLASVAAMLCLMEELEAGEIDGEVTFLFSRAEEVGFAGVLAVCENGWIPKGARVVGLETSKAGVGGGGAKLGEGVVVRVGDRGSVFSAGLTHFVGQCAGHVGDGEAGFKWQRKLMDGGMCSTSAFCAYGWEAAGVCLPLLNYHNMKEEGGIGREGIDVRDFAGMVRLLLEVVVRYGAWEGRTGVRERLGKLYEDEQKERLGMTNAK